MFILGILPRSGTNFLYNLLMLHPDCAPPDPVWEDFLLRHSDLLLEYAQKVAAEWDPNWGVDRQTRVDLEQAIGGGLERFLQARCASRQVVTKTPRVDKLDQFFRLFPRARLLILIRDGRAVIESGVRSFGWRRESALHAVAESAALINRFLADHAERQAQFRLVRYEDLWLDTEAQVRGLLEFLDLEPGPYDFEQARNLPVRGSSDLAREDSEALHWDPVQRPADFDPLSRFASWGNSRHFRYNHVAGRAMETLGYRGVAVGSGFGTRKLWNLALDAAWQVKRLLRPLFGPLAR